MGNLELRFNEASQAVLNKLERIIKDKVNEQKRKGATNKLEIELTAQDIVESLIEGQKTYGFYEKTKKFKDYKTIGAAIFKDLELENIKIDKGKNAADNLKIINSYEAQLVKMFLGILDSLEGEKRAKIVKTSLKLELDSPVLFPKYFAVNYFGFDTGIKGLNQVLGGKLMMPPLYPVSMAIEGQGGVGKSSLAVHLASSAAKKGDLVIYYTLEQMSDDLTVLIENYKLKGEEDFNILKDLSTGEIIEHIKNEAKSSVDPNGLLFISRMPKFSFGELYGILDEIIREASRGYNELSKKEKMARFDPISHDPKTESTTTVYNWTILVDISPT